MYLKYVQQSWGIGRWWTTKMIRPDSVCVFWHFIMMTLAWCHGDMSSTILWWDIIYVLCNWLYPMPIHPLLETNQYAVQLAKVWKPNIWNSMVHIIFWQYWPTSHPPGPIKSFWKTMNTHRQLEMIYMLRWPCEVFNASLIQVYDLFAYNL